MLLRAYARGMKPESIINRVAGVCISLGNSLIAPFARPTHFQRNFRVERPPAEVYAFWRDFHNFKKATRAADQIEVQNPHHSRWVVRGPFGITLSWNAEITVEEQDRRVGWKTMGAADVPHVGQVVFTSLDGGKATDVAIAVDYKMPLGFLGEAIAWVTGAGPSGFISEEIARVKLAIEDHRSRAKDKAEAANLLELAEGPPNPPVRVAPKKNGRNVHNNVNGRGAPNIDLRQRQRTQH